MKLENVIVVTHGNFLKALLPHVLGKKVVKKEDGGFILLEIKDDNTNVLVQNGIEVE